MNQNKSECNHPVSNGPVGVGMPAVLVVDDDLAVLKMLSKLLQRNGFKVVAASSGAEALGLIDSHEIHALLTDVVMPGMSGIELIQEVRHRLPGLPICCMTAYTGEQHPILDEVPILLKPFVNSQLVKALTDATTQQIS
jgi:CheY-like chemotaxis protein